jgi:hypothetical protein
MLMGDFLTPRQLNLPVKIVVFNNGSLAFVELEMMAAGLLDHGSRLKILRPLSPPLPKNSVIYPNVFRVECRWPSPQSP